MVETTGATMFSVVVTIAGVCARTVGLTMIAVAVVVLKTVSEVESALVEYFSVVVVIVGLSVLTVPVVVLTKDSVPVALLVVSFSVVAVFTGCSATNVGLKLVAVLAVVWTIDFEVELVYVALLSVVEILGICAFGFVVVLLKASVVVLTKIFSVVVVVIVVDIEPLLLLLVLSVVDFGAFVIDCVVKIKFASVDPSVVVLGL